jgi:nicotinate-nucleotide pyrophosphorylase (carboxylating)
VRSEEELKTALEFSPYAVLLDNMDDALISRCLAIIKTTSATTLCEVSGGIDQPRLKALAALGVSAASMGRLTTRAANVDISMKISSS